MNLLRLFLVMVVAGFAVPGAHAEVVTIGWDDLLPQTYRKLEAEADTLHQRVQALPPDALEAFDRMDTQRRLKLRIRQGELSVESLVPRDRAILDANVDAKFPLAAELVASIERVVAEAHALDNSANVDLDGLVVRMPGYVLPLEHEDLKTVEFLLVPYVGACIHVPPPPPNQMVHVAFPPGFESEGLYAPVYVTGRLAAVSARVGLYLTDGDTTVETGYRLEATLVEPYEE